MRQNELASKKVVVMGLGRFGGGIGVTRWLANCGAEVVVTDLASAEALASSLAALNDLPVKFHLGGHDVGDLTGCDLLVVSPAVPKEKSQFVAEALARGIPLASEMNLFVQNCPASHVVGVTGSAGKSTTTAMLGSILIEAAAGGADAPPAGGAETRSPKRWRVWVGGNIGSSLLDDLHNIQTDDVVVLELSSFQLEDLARLRWSPRTALITNLKPNHLDRHGTFEAYAEAKMNIVRYQASDGLVFLPAGDEALAERVLAAGAGDRLRRFSIDPALVESLRVPGRHNQQNAAAAAAVARALSVPEAAIRRGLSKFTGLPHRLELVAERDGVRYFNDSKSTTPESSRIALQAFEEPVIMLVGGYDKKISVDDLCRDLAARALAVICYGQTAELFLSGVRAAAGSSGAAGPSVQVERVETLAEAVAAASTLASPGDVVVLSPASASYGQFTNYEERGEVFRRLVQGLAEAE